MAARAAAPGASARMTRAPWLVGLALLPVYLLTLHHAHGWDSITYAARSVHDPLLSERYLSARLFHPHHLLYVPLAMLAQAVAALFGARAGAGAGSGEAAFLAPMVLNALLGAVAAGLAGTLAGRLGASPLRAFAVALATGVSNAVWRYATEVEVMVPALCALLLAAWLLAGGGPRGAGERTRGRMLLAGLALAAAVLLHQLAVPFALAATLVVAGEAWAARRAGAGARTHAWLFALAWIVPVKVAYLAIGLYEAKARTLPALLDWALAARGRSTFAAHGVVHALRETLRAAAESLVSLRPLADARHEPILALAAAGVVLWALAVGLFAAPALVRALARPADAARAVGLRTVALGLAGTIVFVAWFQPWNDDYWVYVPPLAFLLVATCAPRGWLTGRALFVAGVTLMAAVNLVAAILPATDARRASYADLLRFTHDAGLRRGDVLFSGGNDSPIGEGIVALPFFAGVRVIPAPVPGNDADAEHFRRESAEALARARATGHRAYTTGEAWADGFGRSTVPSSVLPQLPVLLRGAPVYRLSGDYGGD